MESRHFRTGQKNILFSCPQCLDSMLTPGFMNSVYKATLYIELRGGGLSFYRGKGEGGLKIMVK